MSPVGRPRTFDRDEALKKAMLVFWEKGYEGTTMSDLIATIGTKAPSVYAAFGNKDNLFNEVVSVYGGMVQEGPLKALTDHASIYQAIESSLQNNVALFSNTENPGSCLIMTAAINCAPGNQEHFETLKDLRGHYKQSLEARFKLAAAQGQLVDKANPEALAEFFTLIVHGMALRSKDGSTRKELQTSADFALLALKPLVKTDAQ